MGGGLAQPPPKWPAPWTELDFPMACTESAPPPVNGVRAPCTELLRDPARAPWTELLRELFAQRGGEGFAVSKGHRRRWEKGGVRGGSPVARRGEYEGFAVAALNVPATWHQGIRAVRATWPREFGEGRARRTFH